MKSLKEQKIDFNSENHKGTVLTSDLTFTGNISNSLYTIKKYSCHRHGEVAMTFTLQVPPYKRNYCMACLIETLDKLGVSEVD